LILWYLVIFAILVYLVFLREDPVQKNKILEFITKCNPSQAKEIYEAIEEHRKGFPVELIAALIYSESTFDPGALGDIDSKGLGQVSTPALDEIERYYKITVDRDRVYEIDYNVYLTGLFLYRAKIAALPYHKELYLYYRSLLTYKNWLTWAEYTYTLADRAWVVYNDLKYGYQKYGREVGDIH